MRLVLFFLIFIWLLNPGFAGRDDDDPKEMETIAIHSAPEVKEPDIWDSSSLDNEQRSTRISEQPERKDFRSLKKAGPLELTTFVIHSAPGAEDSDTMVIPSQNQKDSDAEDLPAVEELPLECYLKEGHFLNIVSPHQFPPGYPDGANGFLEITFNTGTGGPYSRLAFVTLWDSSYVFVPGHHLYYKSFPISGMWFYHLKEGNINIGERILVDYHQSIPPIERDPSLFASDTMPMSQAHIIKLNKPLNNQKIFLEFKSLTDDILSNRLNSIEAYILGVKGAMNIQALNNSHRSFHIQTNKTTVLGHIMKEGCPLIKVEDKPSLGQEGELLLFKMEGKYFIGGAGRSEKIEENTFPQITDYLLHILNRRKISILEAGINAVSKRLNKFTQASQPPSHQDNLPSRVVSRSTEEGFEIMIPDDTLPKEVKQSTSDYGKMKGHEVIKKHHDTPQEKDEKSNNERLRKKKWPPSRDFSLEYSKNPQYAANGNLRRWAYIFVEDSTFLRPLFLLLRATFNIHPLVKDMIPLLYEKFYLDSNFEKLENKVSFGDFYDLGLKQLAHSLLYAVRDTDLGLTFQDLTLKDELKKQLSANANELASTISAIDQPLDVKVEENVKKLKKIIEEETYRNIPGIKKGLYPEFDGDNLVTLQKQKSECESLEKTHKEELAKLQKTKAELEKKKEQLEHEISEIEAKDKLSQEQDRLLTPEQREVRKFIQQPATLVAHLRKEFTKLEQEMREEKIDSMIPLALFYIWGWGCDQNLEVAIDLLDRFIEKTNTSDRLPEVNKSLSQAYEMLGHLHSYRGETEKALDAYSNCASFDSMGHVHLANYWFCEKVPGEPLEKPSAEAPRELRAVADSKALTQAESFKRLRAAADMGNPFALRALIKLNSGDPKEYQLSFCLTNHFKEQYQKMQWVMNLNEVLGGNISALPRLWEHLYFGRGCERDYLLAALCYAIPTIVKYPDILETLNFTDTEVQNDPTTRKDKAKEYLRSRALKILVEERAFAAVKEKQQSEDFQEKKEAGERLAKYEKEMKNFEEFIHKIIKEIVPELDEYRSYGLLRNIGISNFISLANELKFHQFVEHISLMLEQLQMLDQLQGMQGNLKKQVIKFLWKPQTKGQKYNDNEENAKENEKIAQQHLREKFTSQELYEDFMKKMYETILKANGKKQDLSGKAQGTEEYISITPSSIPKAAQLHDVLYWIYSIFNVNDEQIKKRKETIQNQVIDILIREEAKEKFQNIANELLPFFQNPGQDKINEVLEEERRKEQIEQQQLLAQQNSERADKGVKAQDQKKYSLLFAELYGLFEKIITKVLNKEGPNEVYARIFQNWGAARECLGFYYLCIQEEMRKKEEIQQQLFAQQIQEMKNKGVENKIKAVQEEEQRRKKAFDKIEQLNYQKAAVAFYIAENEKTWQRHSGWLIGDGRSSPPSSTEEVKWLRPADHFKEQQQFFQLRIDWCQKLGELGYPVGFYKGGAGSIDFYPTYALASLLQLKGHPKVDALLARLYFTVEGICGSERGEIEK